MGKNLSLVLEKLAMSMPFFLWSLRKQFILLFIHNVTKTERCFADNVDHPEVFAPAAVGAGHRAAPALVVAAVDYQVVPVPVAVGVGHLAL